MSRVVDAALALQAILPQPGSRGYDHWFGRLQVDALRAALEDQASCRHAQDVQHAGALAWRYITNFVPNPQLDNGWRVTDSRRVAEVNGLPETITALGPIVETPSTMFVVLATWDHEPSGAVQVFATKELADGFSARCREYDLQRPVYQQAPDDDAVYDQWLVDHEKWISAHPAGRDNAAADDYAAVEVPFTGRPA